MSDAREFFGVKRIDFSGARRDRTVAEMEAICKRIESDAKKVDRRAFVEYAEQHPEVLTAWDMRISFEEFARRVRAGEYD